VTYAVDKLKKEHNDLSKEIGKRMKESKGEDKCEV
jgi:seryl-tRNA synthetase